MYGVTNTRGGTQLWMPRPHPITANKTNTPAQASSNALRTSLALLEHARDRGLLAPREELERVERRGLRDELGRQLADVGAEELALTGRHEILHRHGPGFSRDGRSIGIGPGGIDHAWISGTVYAWLPHSPARGQGPAGSSLAALVRRNHFTIWCRQSTRCQSTTSRVSLVLR